MAKDRLFINTLLSLLSAVFLIIAVLDGIFLYYNTYHPADLLVDYAAVSLSYIVLIELILFVLLVYSVREITKNTTILAVGIVALIAAAIQPMIFIIATLGGHPSSAGTGINIVSLLLFAYFFMKLSRELKAQEFLLGAWIIGAVAVFLAIITIVLFPVAALGVNYTLLAAIAAGVILFIAFLSMGNTRAFKFLISINNKIQNK